MFFKLRQVFNTLCKTQLLCYSNSLLHPVDTIDSKKDVSIPEKDLEPVKPKQQNGPIRIAWPNKWDKSVGISFNLKPLYDILEHKDVRDCPVVICSVNGNTRKGKSFLLNQGVKYLKYQQEKPKNTNGHSWIHQDLYPSFEWSPYMSSVTEGICIWPEPLFCYDSHGKKKLCVILMDIQGLSGRTNQLNEEYKMYAFSSLISSLFIFFNSSEGRHCLESLNEFCEFTKVIANDERPETHSLPYTFGTLLIRLIDFAWPEFPLDQGCCFYDKDNTAKRLPATDLYDVYFRTDTDDETFKKKREQLLRLFDNITIATTPPFGVDMPKTLHPPKSNEGEKWEPRFQEGTTKFVENVFSYKFLENKTKKHLGREILGANLVPIIQRWEERISMPNYSITDEPKIARQAELYFRKLITKCVKQYNSEFNAYKINPVGDDFISFHKKTKKQLHEGFWTVDCHFREYTGTYWMQLENQVDERLLSEWKDIKAKRDKNVWTSKVLAGVVASVATATQALTATAEPIAATVLLGVTCIVLAGAGVFILKETWNEKQETEYIETISTRIRNQQKEN